MDIYCGINNPGSKVTVKLHILVKIHGEKKSAIRHWCCTGTAISKFREFDCLSIDVSRCLHVDAARQSQQIMTVISGEFGFECSNSTLHASRSDFLTHIHAEQMAIEEKRWHAVSDLYQK